MKQLIIGIATIIAVALLTVNYVKPILAGGDQVQGDLGIGSVVQNGPCPFGVDTPPVGPEE